MSKGFAPIKYQPKQPVAYSAKLTLIFQIQADLFSYFNDYMMTVLQSFGQ